MVCGEAGITTACVLLFESKGLSVVLLAQNSCHVSVGITTPLIVGKKEHFSWFSLYCLGSGLR